MSSHAARRSLAVKQRALFASRKISLGIATSLISLLCLLRPPSRPPFRKIQKELPGSLMLSTQRCASDSGQALSIALLKRHRVNYVQSPRPCTRFWMSSGTPSDGHSSRWRNCMPAASSIQLTVAGDGCSTLAVCQSCRVMRLMLLLLLSRQTHALLVLALAPTRHTSFAC